MTRIQSKLWIAIVPYFYWYERQVRLFNKYNLLKILGNRCVECIDLLLSLYIIWVEDLFNIIPGNDIY